ncbi:CocE/NonD family hydrolase [Nocardia sp. NPDC006630]|uniref:CocE/NonD family hydrolase n=1 Tax=Nocardia sp. NPDC006630 TaxID=3157181 RepID=UPI0033BD02D9
MRLFARLGAASAAAVVATLALTTLTVPAAHADPPDNDPAAAWTAAQDGPPQYPGVHVDWDVPITMSDGTVLKSNVYRPMDAAGHIVDTPLPTIVNMTPYTKLAYMLLDSAVSIPGLFDGVTDLINRFDLFDLNGTPLSSLGDQIKVLSGGGGRVVAADRHLIQSGYTEIVADVRGTGFSEGVWPVFGEREQQDTAEIAQWAANQPWSDGKIGLAGVSNGGISALQGAEQQPESVKAVFSVVPGSDLLRDTVAPGGGFDIGFVPFWLLAVNTAKWLPDLSSIATGNFDWKWLADRVASPITFIDTLLRALVVPSVDAIPADMKQLLDPEGPFRSGITGHPDRITAPTFIVGGWHDIFNNSESTAYNAIPLPADQKKLLMGDWYHVTLGSGLGVAGAPPRLDVLQHAWFDKWLKGIDNGIDAYSPATLFQQGGGWTSSDRYPRAGMTYARQYLSADPSGTAGTVVHDGSLSATAPSEPTTLTVSPGLSTVCSRDGAQGTAGVLGIIDACGKDSRLAEVAALTFTGQPVGAPTAISGSVNVHLNTVLDATDGYWSATLNDVAPDGQSTVLTTGQLTASLRKLDEDKSKKSPNGDYTAPFPTLTLEDRQAIVPGEPTTLEVGLEPTDAVLQPGHRLRVDIYAANFPKGMMIPALLLESQLRPQHLVLDPAAPSWVNVPSSTTF